MILHQFRKTKVPFDLIDPVIWDKLNHQLKQELVDSSITKFLKFLQLLLISDGAGRSGVYLAIDANIELSEEDGVFDVYGYLVKMRSQRRGLVETLVSIREFFYSNLISFLFSSFKIYGSIAAID